MEKLGKAGVPTHREQKRLALVTGVGNHARRNLAMIAVSYRLGLRANEIAGLRISDVLEKAGHLREECKLRTSITKGGRPRVAYLTNLVVKNALDDYLNHRSQAEGILFNPSSALFKSQKGNHFSPNSMQQLLARLHHRAGIPNGRSHSGRRWFATELISKGIDLKAVSVLMGHSSISMTAKYAEDNPQRLRRISAELL